MWRPLIKYEEIEVLNKENGSRWHHYYNASFAFSDTEQFILIKECKTGDETIIPITNILAITRKGVII